MLDWKQEIIERLKDLNLSPAREAEIVEELAQYLQDRYDELRASGATKQEAEQAVLVELTGSRYLARELRRLERATESEVAVFGSNTRTNIIADLRQDLLYGFRMLRKSPGFTATAVLTLALGIGANTAIFSAVYNVLLKPLPFPEANRLVALDEYNDGLRMGVSWPDLRDWRDRATSLSDVAALHSSFFNLTERLEPVRLNDLDVSWNFFQVLGIKAQLGRTFTPEDDRWGAAPTLVLSDSIWRNTFGADPAIVGQPVTLDGKSFTVIGVLQPPGFEYLYP